MIADIIILVVNLAITLFVTVLTWLSNILPSSPFDAVAYAVPAQFAHYVGYINYLIPLNLIIPVFSAWAVAIVGYKFITWIMHIIKIN